MGLSGKMEEHLHTSQVREMGIPVIKRFSGGGTVVVDEGTVFATLVFQADCVPDVECYPKPVMRWTEDLYGPVFLPFGNFELHEQDYTFGSLKFGGNAQAITKQRWLHHTSFLWNYNENLMALLKAPERQPAYRQKRSHEEFLCRLKDHMPSKTGLMDGICAALERKGYVLQVKPHQDNLSRHRNVAQMQSCVCATVLQWR
ncbi:unnamed protein product [Ostreobium quekettii]|uniref:BPL/LPL catalytic domain-containing protein n=1 Tax=Ostreobium quekettii TaxID=121088 RepID=A0A8S1J7L2_9CHLO|nr:unnamed protein product [Ostreobium quekettii]